MRKSLRAMSVVFVASLAFAAHGSANVFDDAVFWFRGGKDCVTADGYMEQGEFFDDLNANYVTHVNHQMPMSSAGYYEQDGYASLRAKWKANAKFQPEQVVFPALGTNIVKEMQVLHISSIGVLQSKNTWYYPFSVNPRSIFARYSISNEYTIVSRVRLDNLERVNYLFKIGYNETDKQGLKIGFMQYKSSGTYKCLAGYYFAPNGDKRTAFQLQDLPVPTNTWVDVAVVVVNSKLRIGIAASQALASNPMIGFKDYPMTEKYELLDSDDSYCLFCPDNISGYSTTENRECFLGSVQQLAIWGRALSDQEVMAAFGMPRPTIFRTGFDNGSSNEFGGERSGSSQTIDGLGSWQDVSDTMLAGDEWTVNFNALRDEAGLPQIFSIKALSDSAAVQIEPILNETSLRERRVAANGRTFWPVPKDLITEGANTLILKRKDGGAGTFKMDAMELGGSLGVGKITGNGLNDQRVYPKQIELGVPSAADPNTQHWPIGLQPYVGITNLQFRVWVDPDVVDKATSRFWTQTQCANTNSTDTTIQGNEEFQIYVNGTQKATRGSSTDWDMPPIEIPFQPGELKAGWNDFNFLSDDKTCHWLVRYYRFETVLPRGFSLPPPGMAIIVR